MSQTIRSANPRWERYTTRRYFQAGEVISKEGDPGDVMYLIHSGAVAVTKAAPEGEPLVLGYRGPGELLGEIALISDAPRTASMVAAKPCELLAISKADFWGLLRSDEDFRQMVMETLIDHLLTADRSRVVAEAFERDLSERFDALTTEKERMEELEKLRQETSRFIIHDLRSPLHLAMAALAMLEEEPNFDAETDAARFVLMAQGGLQRMLNLVDALLDLGRFETGQGVNREPMDVRDMIERCVKGSQPLALINQITLASDYPGGADLPSVPADATRIERVIMNLIDNAIRYTPVNGSVTVRAWRDGDVVYTAIDDTGQGIPPQQRERIFDRFVQAEGETRSQGFGLGLAFCKSAVEAHGGTIRAEAGPDGTGTRMVFSLPLEG